MSFGTNVKPSLLPPEKIKIFANVFSKLPYNVLWKWNTEESPGRSDNVKISKWFPQSDILSELQCIYSKLCIIRKIQLS